MLFLAKSQEVLRVDHLAGCKPCLLLFEAPPVSECGFTSLLLFTVLFLLPGFFHLAIPLLAVEKQRRRVHVQRLAYLDLEQREVFAPRHLLPNTLGEIPGQVGNLRYEGRFESEDHLKAWLLRVAINRCRDITRAARQKDTELDENIPAPESGNDGSVLDAVRTLPENYRNAVYLHYYEGYTAAEVGRMLGAPTNTVLSWLRRARAQLHTLLKEEIEDEVV